MKSRNLSTCAVTAMAVLFGSGLASASTLYGVTGDGAGPAATLFTLDQSTAAEALVLDLGTAGDVNDDGEAIGFNPTEASFTMPQDTMGTKSFLSV